MIWTYIIYCDSAEIQQSQYNIVSSFSYRKPCELSQTLLHICEYIDQNTASFLQIYIDVVKQHVMDPKMLTEVPFSSRQQQYPSVAIATIHVQNSSSRGVAAVLLLFFLLWYLVS